MTENLPICFRPVSNGEFLPRAPSDAEIHTEAVARDLIDRHAARSHLDRRDFLHSTSALAACLTAINVTAGGIGGSYILPAEAGDDPAAADAALAGREFIFDIQTHHVMPGRDWERNNPSMKLFLDYLPGRRDFSRYAYVKEIFLDSDTTCAVLSAVPAIAEQQPLPDEDAATTREIVDTLGKTPRLWTHALVTPNVAPLDAQLDAMERVSKERKIAAWKTYTLWGPKGVGYWLDDEKIGIPMIEKARSLGIKTICTHKGFPLWGTKGGFHVARDVGVVANRYPDVKFIVYHSGYDPEVTEGAYDPEDSQSREREGDPQYRERERAVRGVNGLLRSLDDNHIPAGGNVYAELGSTWWALMKKPDEAAHVLGKLLKRVGENNVLWGTDCIWYGSPQPQIAAFRAFEISKEFQEKYGYPALTKELKAKIFGLNSAAVYGVDPAVARPAIEKDAVEKLKQSYLPDRSPTFAVYGPRTRREFLTLLSRRGGRPA